MFIESSAFENGGIIPKKFGYKFENISPPISIGDVPKGTISLALIMDDPDAMAAVGKVWTHWILWNIDPEIKEISENSLPKNSITGKNDFGEVGYGGPAPPDKEHTYVFKLFALKIPINNTTLTKLELEEIMNSNIISSADLKGKFSPQ